ncbi:MAG TPA: hypothetical protein VIK54_11545 [Acidimicrobiia bacterium]
MGILLAVVGVGAALAAVLGLMSAVRRDPFTERVERINGERLLGVPPATVPVSTGMVHDEAWALLAAAKQPTDEDHAVGPALGVLAGVDPAPTGADSV